MSLGSGGGYLVLVGFKRGCPMKDGKIDNKNKNFTILTYHLLSPALFCFYLFLLQLT